MASHLCCEGFRRRDMLRFGALSGMGLGLNLGGYLRMAQAGELKMRPGKATAAIFIQLPGGPSHMDTFDLKPDAPDTHRGEFKAIKTNVKGIEISEHLPKLAKCTDKFAILRGVSHTLAAHALGQEYLITGNRPLPSLQFPGYGAVVSKEMTSPPDLPPFVAVPSTQQTGGYLGVEYGPFNTTASPRKGQRMDIRGLTLRNGVTVADVERRHNLLNRFDTTFASIEKDDALLSGLDRFGQRAYDMMRSNAARDAFDLTKESPAIAEMFEDNQFSQSCLLATRLVEAGVRFVTITYGGWDTHQENFERLKDRLLPPFDDGLAGLFNTLAAKGLLDTTAVFVTGEFGRTPKINNRSPNGGRDHWARAMFCLMAGGGMSGGQVIGASDELGMGPKEEAITPDDVAASFFHSLGIDHTKEYHTPSGRPVMIVRHGNPIKQLFA